MRYIAIEEFCTHHGVEEKLIREFETKLEKKIQTGQFGADMKVAIVNDGPVTIIIDTKNKE